VLYVDIAQVYRDIAHVVIAIHLCFKCMFQMFHMFQTNVANVAYTCMLQAYVSSVFIRMFASVLSRCCICLQWFSIFFQVFLKVFQTLCFKCFICLFLNVSKVDWVLHMGCACEAAGSADDVWDGVGDVRGGAGPLPVCSLASPTC